MIYIFLCIFFNLMTNILLKFYPKYNFDIYHSAMVNYLVCAILSFCNSKYYTNKYDYNLLNNVPWSIVIALGMLLPIILILMSKSLNKVGLIKTDTIQRISLIIPIAFSFTFLNEQFTLYKSLGIIIAILAMILVIYNKNYKSQKNNFEDYTLLFLIWISLGIVDILFKLLTQKNSFYFCLNLIFFIAFIFMLIFNIIFYKKNILIKNIFIGIILGIFNFFTALFYIKSHKSFFNNPSIVFTSISIGVIAISTIIGVLMFNEKINKNNYFGIFLSICSIIMLFAL